MTSTKQEDHAPQQQSWTIRGATSDELQSIVNYLGVETGFKDRCRAELEGRRVAAAAHTLYTVAMAVRNGQATPDDYRATVRSIRAEIGEREYTLAKVAMMNMDEKVNR